jgi:hypothetical protein
MSAAERSVAIDSIVPAAWPPEHHDLGVIEWVLKSLDSLGPGEPWRLFDIVLSNPRTLIGTCGIKQAPDAKGCVEVGYTVLLLAAAPSLARADLVGRSLSHPHPHSHSHSHWDCRNSV